MAWSVSAQAAPTVIVYDASNSMWGQINGEAKVTIARRVMADIIRDWDESSPLGLVAYGHRRAGDCTDIQTVVPVGPVDKDAMIARVDALSPKGKTPLTAAIRHAAEALKYRDEPATVVLVSDGIETCDANPCAAAAELNRAGINFTAHVIGFDVGNADQAQLKCIADNTGGRFFAASDAEGLEQALSQATKAATKQVPVAQVTVTAPDTALAGSDVQVSWQGEKIQPRDYVTLVPADARPNARGPYARVQDHATDTLHAPGEPGDYQVRYVSSATGQAVASKPITLTEPETTVSAPATATAGADLAVHWTNAVHPRDYVTIVPADAPADEHGHYIRVQDKTEGTLRAPAEPGEYQVRYVLQASGQAIASAPVTVTTEGVTVTAPDSVVAGSNFTVDWNNVIHPRDYVTVVPAGAPKDESGHYIRVQDHNRGTLRAPAEPGDYEVRYILQESGEAIASTPIQVTEAKVSVSAPESVTGGANFNAHWSDAINPRDYVTIVEAGAPEDKHGNYVRVQDGREGELRAPAVPGKYEVRYILQESGEAIASTPIQVTAQHATVSAPASVTGGAEFTVHWTRAVHPRDYVTIVPTGTPKDKYGEYTRVNGREHGELTAPAEPGDYEVRYMLQVNGQAIASAPVTVTAPEVSLQAPASVKAKSEFTVSWSQSIHPRDYVTVVKAGAAPDAYGDYIRVGKKTEGTLTAPGEPGQYEVRYLLQVNDRAIASRPLTVE